MAQDTTKCEIKAVNEDRKYVKVRTARGRLSYPHLFTPRDGKWSTSLVFPKNADLSALNEAVEIAAALSFGKDHARKYPGLKKPVLLTAKSPSMGFDAELFPHFIRTSTKVDGQSAKAPEVVDHMKNLVEASEVYPGRWAMLTIKVKGYDTDGNRGVTCYVDNAQVLEHGEQVGGGRASASDDFEAVDISDSADAIFR